MFFDSLHVFFPKLWTFFPPNFGEKSVPKWWYQNSNVVSTCRTWWCFLTPHRGANLRWIFFCERPSMKLWYMISQIFWKLHAKLNFGIFCYSLRPLKKVSTFCLKVIFFIAIAWKNKNKLMTNRQIEMTRAQLFVSM